MCVIVLYGMASMDNWKFYIFLQVIAALSEVHATWSLSVKNPEKNISTCPVYFLFYFVVIVFPTLTSMLMKNMQN